MRPVLILTASVVLCVGCSDSSSDSGPVETQSNVEAEPGPEVDPDVESAADEADEPSTPEAVATTTGFIEARVNGEPKRFEYLEAAHNTAAANGTFLEAKASAASEERFAFSLVNLDVREMDFPTTIRSNTRAMQMAGMNYWDAEAAGHPVVFSGDSLQCESLEGLLLRCTFSGRAHPDEGGPVEITDGRLEVQLTTNAIRDGFIEAVEGAGGRRPTR